MFTSLLKVKCMTHCYKDTGCKIFDIYCERLFRKYTLRTTTPKYSYAKIVGREASLDVPNIVHFIWMGKVLPEKYINNMRTFNNNTAYEVS